MFKEKRFIYKERMNNSAENSESLQNQRWEQVTPSVNKANKAIANGEEWAKKASELKSKIGDNPTQELETKYDELISSLENLNNGVGNNTNNTEFKMLLQNFDKNISKYEELTRLTKEFVETNEGEAARLEGLGKKSDQEMKEDVENVKANIEKAEEEIMRTIAQGGASKKNKKNIKKAIENLATLLNEDDPRVETKYWLTLAREEGKIDEWKAEYAGQEIASNNIENNS